MKDHRVKEYSGLTRDRMKRSISKIWVGGAMSINEGNRRKSLKPNLDNPQQEIKISYQPP